MFSPGGHCRRFLFLRYLFHGSTSLPPFAPRPLRRFTARMGALTPDRVTFRLVTDPRSGLPASLAPPSRRSAPNHPPSPRRHLRAPSATGSLSVPGFTTRCRLAARAGRIGFTCVADRRFTSSCSPPRLAATQLPSVTGPRARTWRGLPPREWCAFAGAHRTALRAAAQFGVGSAIWGLASRAPGCGSGAQAPVGQAESEYKYRACFEMPCGDRQNQMEIVDYRPREARWSRPRAHERERRPFTAAPQRGRRGGVISPAPMGRRRWANKPRSSSHSIACRRTRKRSSASSASSRTRSRPIV